MKSCNLLCASTTANERPERRPEYQSIRYQLHASCDKVLLTFYALSFIKVFPTNYSLPKQLKEIESQIRAVRGNQYFIDPVFFLVK